MFLKKKAAAWICLAGLILPGLAWARPEPPIHTWKMEGVGLVEAPAGLTVTPFTDIMESVFFYVQAQLKREAEKKHMGANPLELQKYRNMMEDVKQFARENGLQGYQLALRGKDSYDIAMAVSARLPEEALPFLPQVEALAEDPAQQQELMQMGTEAINAYGDGSDELPVFQFEVLSYEPIQRMENEDFKITSVSGSIAFTMFQIITPYAFKAYLVQNGEEAYVVFLNTNPANRGKWNSMMDQMLMQMKQSNRTETLFDMALPVPSEGKTTAFGGV